MAYKVNTIFTATYDGLKNAISSVKSQFKTLEQSANSVKTKIGEAFDSANRDYKNYSKNIKDSTELINTGLKASAIGVATITVPTILAGKNALIMAGQYESATQTLEYTLGEAKSIVDDFITHNANSIGMAEKDAYKFANIYSNLLTTMTNNQETNADYTNRLMQASAVIMSKTGRTFTDVADRIRSGLLGNTEAIEDLGVNVNVALLQTTEAFKQIANGRSWEKLSFQEQQQVRLLGILEQTSKKYGETVGDNLSLKLAQTSAGFENVKNEASKFLAIGLQPLITGLNTLSSNILVFVKWLNTLDDGTKQAITTFIVIVALIPVVALVFFTLIKAITSYTVFINAASTSTAILTKAMLGLLGTALLLVAGIAMIAYSLGAFDKLGKSNKKTTTGVESASKAINGLSSAQKSNADNAKKASKANKELADNLQGFDEINKLNLDKGNNNLDNAISIPGVDLSGIDTSSFDNIGDQFGDLNDKVQGFKDNMEKAKPIIGMVGGALAGLGLFKVGKGLSKLISGAKISSLSKIGTTVGKIGTVTAGLAEGVYVVDKTLKDYDKVVNQANDGTVDFYGNALNATQSITGMAGAGATIGLAFGPAGAAIGAVAGSVVGLITNIVSYNKTLNGVAKSNIYGDMQIQASQLESISQQITGSYEKQSTKLKEYKEKVQELSDAVNTNADSLENMSTSFSMIGDKISKDEAEKIYNTINELGTNSIELINENMNQSISVLKNTFDKTSALTKKEEEDILKTTISANSIRKKEISSAQSNITKTYEKAIKERGYLTDDEYKYISEQLAKIRELTNTEMLLSAGEQEKIKRRINDKNYKLDEESYKKISAQIETANAEALKIIEDNYNQRYAEALKAGEDAKLLAEKQGKTAEEQERLKQQAINNVAKSLQEEYNNDIKAANNKTEQLRADYSQRLLEDWAELNQKNSSELTEVEKRQKEFLEEMLGNFGIKGTELIEKASKIGKKTGETISTETKSNIKWGYPQLPSLDKWAKQTGKDGAKALNSAWDKGVDLGIKNLPSSIKFNTETSGSSVYLKPSLVWRNLTWNAKGGVYGGTSIIGVGEYVGARSNPEIVAPKKMIYDTVIQANSDTNNLRGYSKNGSDSIQKRVEVELNLQSGGVKVGKQIIDLILDANDFYDLGLI